jgi:hypothetical protein
VTFSPQVNYSIPATAAASEVTGPLLRVEGVVWSAQQIPTAFISVF